MTAPMPWGGTYATVEELAAFVRVNDEADASQMGLALAAASRAIDRACRRQFGGVSPAASWRYTARNDRSHPLWTIPIDDLWRADDLVVEFDSAGDGTFADTITDFTLRPVDAPDKGQVWTEILVHGSSVVQPTAVPDAVRVTGWFGWGSAPDAVREACLLQASRLLIRRDSPYGVAGSPEAGSEVRLLSRLDPDVRVALTDYRRRGVVFA